MIKPKLYGRLGNQCFQIAAAIAHARKMDTTWAIPRVTNDMRIWPNYFLHTVPRQNITMFDTRDYYKELRHCYDSIPNKHDLTLDGYFQSEKYFHSIDDKFEIGNALNFHCLQQDYIAIHVRRGDFITDYADKHPALTMEYYEKSIDQCFINGYYNYKIYSDDINWCMRNFNRTGLNFSYSNIKDPLADMRDMYNAAGFIISNSTFSLFPALLRLDKPITIAPAESRWYGPGNAHLETNDLMPERFIKI